MTDWLRFIGMIFYAPLRGMREVRDRGGLASAALAAFLIQFVYILAVGWLAGDRSIVTRGPSLIFNNLFNAAAPVLLVAVIVVPVTTLIANLFDRRGSFRVVLQQEYGSLASVMLFAVSGATIIALISAVLLHFSGIQSSYVATTAESLDSEQMRRWTQLFGLTSEQIAAGNARFRDPIFVSRYLFELVRFPLFAIGGVAAVRETFRLAWLRSVAVFFLTALASLPLSLMLYPLFSHIAGSPFLLLFAFILLRGYFQSVVSTQRARTAFKQNLEAATINPRDSSAHYNLALIHQSRGELDQARERFQRAIEIDPDETDAHYQLGRIARSQNRWAEAIGHFEQVVQRDQYHAQNEIWREIGATYISAGQFEDARDTLQKFLERRENDPQGLYLMGRAHAGLGDQQEAASSMQACIDAVKTAPAYKYRAEKRWLHEAQQFLKGKKRAAVSSER
jgi:Tfp pilus assembly protein PilF